MITVFRLILLLMLAMISSQSLSSAIVTGEICCYDDSRSSFIDSKVLFKQQSLTYGFFPHLPNIIENLSEESSKAMPRIGTLFISLADFVATKSAKKIPSPSKTPDFVVSPSGTTFPIPKGAQGPVPVINPAGKKTGVAFTSGKGGANGQVDTIRIMNPTLPRGRSPGYPNGYIKYQNKNGQGVNPYTGKTIPNSQSHFPIE